MNNWIKKYSNLLTTFVDNTLIPLVNNKTTQGIHAIQQWAKLKNLITQTYETECNDLSLSKIQKFILDIRPKPIAGTIMRTNSLNLGNTITKPIMNGNSNSNSNSKNLNVGGSSNQKQKSNGQKSKSQLKTQLYQNDPKRYNLGQNSRKLDYGQQKKVIKNDNNNPKVIIIRQTTESIPRPTNQPQQKEPEKVEPKLTIESLQGILSSFKKLCTNVENNHKKLVSDRESISH